MDEDQRLAQFNESRRQQIISDDEFGEEEWTPEEIEEIKIQAPQEPTFPIFIFGLAMLKDLIDILSVGLLGWLAAIVLSGVIWLWIFTKSSFLRKQLLKRLIKPIIAAAFVAIFPGLNFLPESSVLVILIYRGDKGIVKKAIDKLEQVTKSLEKLRLIEKI